MAETCNTGRAAQILGVTPRTIQLWADAGTLNFKKTVGGHRRYELEYIQALANQLENGLSPSPLSDTNHRPVKVLVMEDDAALLNLYNLYILSWGLPVEVELTADGYDGLLKIGRFNPDILILDLSLPGLDGFQIIGSLMKNRLIETMKLIVVTSLDDNDLTINLGKNSNIVLLRNPIPFDQIRGEIQTVIENRSK